MRVRTVVRHGDSILLEPIQEPALGWCVRPGTSRVAQPYDDSSVHSTPGDSQGITTVLGALQSTGTPEPPQHSSRLTDHPPSKKQKRSRTNIDNAHDHEQDLVQWIKAEFQSVIEQDSSQSWIRNMQSDYFYGTLVDAPACNTFALDLVKLQPTLRMLRSGFVSTSDRNAGTDQEDLTFDQIELEKGSQQLDLGDIYELLVMNNHSVPVLFTFPTEGQPRYLMPSRSAFVVSDLDRIHGLKSVARLKGGFDIIVMDPPWQNASVDRMGHYDTMDMYDLFKIPIPDLLRAKNEYDRGGIVAVWITNRTKVKKMVIEKLFPTWELQLVAHWIWLKVTTRGEPVLSLDNMHRRPYEGILIGRQRPILKGSAKSTRLPPGTNINRKLLVSVPAQHSKKPSINTLLEEVFFPQNPELEAEESIDPDDAATRDDGAGAAMSLNKLELFARNLEENVVSWGNEPIRHQYCGRGSDGDRIVQDGYLIPCPTLATHSYDAE